MKNMLIYISQDLRTWVIFIARHTRPTVIATARNAAGSNPYLSSPEGVLDCFVGYAASQ
jgi:hypothetical protein